MKFENVSDAEKVVKRMVFLAWQACGGTFGMGALQDRGPQQTEGQVWHAAYNSTDYVSSDNKPGQVYCDYVQGRMMKLHVRWTADTIELNDNWRGDYQSFCRTYREPKALFDAAVASINQPVEQAAR
jgi:hypothetical protein